MSSLELNIPFSTDSTGLTSVWWSQPTLYGNHKEGSQNGSSSKPITLIDDYAHHPTEIKATLTAARDVLPNTTYHWRISTTSIYSTARSLGRILQPALKRSIKDLMPQLYQTKSVPKPASLCLHWMKPILIASRLQAEDVVIHAGRWKCQQHLHYSRESDQWLKANVPRQPDPLDQRYRTRATRWWYPEEQ